MVRLLFCFIMDCSSRLFARCWNCMRMVFDFAIKGRINFIWCSYLLERRCNKVLTKKPSQDQTLIVSVDFARCHGKWWQPSEYRGIRELRFAANSSFPYDDEMGRSTCCCVYSRCNSNSKSVHSARFGSRCTFSLHAHILWVWFVRRGT